MGTFTQEARDKSVAARKANAIKRRKLAKKLGVNPGDLLPSRLAKNPIEGVPIPGKPGKTVHFPIEAIPDMRVVRRPAKTKVAKIDPAVAMAAAMAANTNKQEEVINIVAKLMVAVAKELYNHK